MEKQLAMGDHVITKGTKNADVPDNAALLTDFTTKNASLKARADAATAARLASLSTLAGHTESATGGDPVKIQGTGFDVKNPATPTQPLDQVVNLKVELNGMVGYSTLSWDTLAGADHYVVQSSPEPITATSWSFVTSATSASYYGNGATAGQKMWYRVAG